MVRQDYEMEQTQLVREAFHLTKAMERASMMGEWPRVQELATQRSSLLLSLEREQNPVSLDLIRQILLIGDTITENLMTAQSTVTAEHHRFRENVWHAKEYLDVGAMTSVAKPAMAAPAPSVKNMRNVQNRAVRNYAQDDDDWLF
jgi:flagellar protein FliT